MGGGGGKLGWRVVLHPKKCTERIGLRERFWFFLQFWDLKAGVKKVEEEKKKRQGKKDEPVKSC